MSDATRRPMLAPRGPVLPTERALAPDLARGAMLLFIALVNAPGLAPGNSVTGSVAARGERIANIVTTLFVYARAYPVFAIMLGYGLEQMARRLEAAGATTAEVRGVLLRRGLWLIVFGFVHAALLYFGDFLGAYGIISIIATLALLHRDRAQRVLLWLWAVSIVEMIVLAVLIVAGLAHGGEIAGIPSDVMSSSVAPSYIASIGARLREWPMHTLTVVPAIFIVCLGMWAARRRLLEDLAAHRTLLRRVAIAGLGTAVAGGVPLALVYAGVLHADARTVTLITLLHRVSGMFGGPGYVALLGIASLRLSRGVPPLVTRLTAPIVALGRRSLSGYLFQSIVWVTVLPPYSLSLASRFGSPLLTALAVAVITWLVSLAGASWLQRHGHPGPAESLLRRLAYGASRQAATLAPDASPANR